MAIAEIDLGHERDNNDLEAFMADFRAQHVDELEDVSEYIPP
jgi:hypothetical protein